MKEIVTLTLLIVLALYAVMATQSQASDFEVIPAGGLSLPVGGSDWSPGYTLGVEMYRHGESRLEWGGRVAFHRWTPNAEELLSIGGRDMFIEDRWGWNVIGDVSAMVRYSLLGEEDGCFCGLRVDGGLGLAYDRSADVRVTGFYTEGRTAQNREINRSAKTSVAPVFSAGLSMQILNAIQPGVRFQHVFTGSGTSLVYVNLGFFAR